MLKYLLTFLFVFQVYGETHFDVINEFVSGNNFVFVDSLTLKIPLEYTPKIVYDFAVSKNYIYMLAISKYPVLQFTKNGEFQSAIGKMGNGPESFQMMPLKIASNMDNDDFIAIDGPMGVSLYHFQPGKKLKKYTDSSFLGFVDIEYWKGNPIIVYSGNARMHIKILNKNFKVMQEAINLPKESRVLNMVRTAYWGIQRVADNAFLSTPGYPFRIYRLNFIKNSSNFNKSLLPLTHDMLSDFNAPSYKPEYSLKEYKKYSRIQWLIGNGKTILGAFYSYGKDGKPLNSVFLIKNNVLIKEWHFDFKDLMRIIPVGNQIIFYNYKNFENSSDLKISFWKLK